MPKPHRTVLLVKDLQDDTLSYETQLQFEEAFTYRMINGQYDGKTLALCQAQQVDGILLDVHSKVSQHLQFFQQLQAYLGEQCPPIVMIDDGDIDTAVWALKHGVTDYLVRDRITPAELRLALRNAIENAELKRKLQRSQEKFHTSVENLMDCFGIFTALRDDAGQIVDFRIDYLNAAACENNRMPREQQIGRGLCEVLPGHYESGLFDAYCHLVATGDPLVWDSVIYEDTYGGVQDVVRAFDIRATKLEDGFVASWRNITDRKRLELELELTVASLRQDQEQFQQPLDQSANDTAITSPTEPSDRSLLETMAQMVWTADATGAVTYWNQSWYDYTGLRETESMGLAGARTVHPEERYRTLAQWGHAVVEQKPFEIEYRIRGRDGQYRWFLCRGIPDRDSQGKMTGWVGTITDIDRLKRSEVSLRWNEYQVRRILDSLFSFVGVMTPEGILVEANQTALAAASLKPSDVLGKPFEQTYWWSYSPQVQQRLREAIDRAAGGESVRFDVQVRLGKDQFVTIDFALVPLLDGAGQVEFLIPSGIDISDRLRSEACLRDSQGQLQRQLAEIEAIYQTAPIGLTVLDRELRFVRINQKLADINGLPVEAHLGRTVREVLPVLADDVEQLLYSILATGKPLLNVELHGETPAQPGMRRTWLEHFLPLRQGEQTIGISIVCEEITERKQAELQREQLLQQEQVVRHQAERANRLKDEFLAILSHELRSPLNPILGWARLLQTRQLDAERTTEALATIERNAKLQTQLVDDLLDVARILRGKLKLDSEPVDLVDVIAGAMETVHAAAEAKFIGLHCTVAGTEMAAWVPAQPSPFYVSGDVARLHQILWNLLTNAIKFTPNGGRVDVQLQPVADQVQISVQDTGKGIHPDFLPYLFESFRQEDVAINRQHGGLGLGLSIARYLVEAHGGTITAASPGEGMGATFTVQFPRLQPPPERPPTATPTPTEPNLHQLRILAVDDDLDTRELLKVLLTQYGAEVMVVESGEEVLTLLEPFQPHVLICDIGMPEMDGYILMQQVRSRPPNMGGQIPALALTAYARQDDQQRALDSGYQKHINKPLEVEPLVHSILELAAQCKS
jgi:PAS domain S-box-containing protein